MGLRLLHTGSSGASVGAARQRCCLLAPMVQVFSRPGTQALQKGQSSVLDPPQGSLPASALGKDAAGCLQAGPCPPKTVPLAPAPCAVGRWWVEEAGGDRLSLFVAPGEKLMLPRKGGPWAQLQSPLPVPSLRRGPGERPQWGGGGDAGALAGLPLCISGLAFFSCVGADANVTAGHGTEGLACGTDKSCAGKVAVPVPAWGCSGEPVVSDGSGAVRGSRSGWRTDRVFCLA